jgi:hypothetical protein
MQRDQLHADLWLVAAPLSFKERAGVRMGLYRGFLIPIPTLILPLKGRKLVYEKTPPIALVMRRAIITQKPLN